MNFIWKTNRLLFLGPFFITPPPAIWCKCNDNVNIFPHADKWLHKEKSMAKQNRVKKCCKLFRTFVVAVQGFEFRFYILDALFSFSITSHMESTFCCIYVECTESKLNEQHNFILLFELWNIHSCTVHPWTESYDLAYEFLPLCHKFNGNFLAINY